MLKSRLLRVEGIIPRDRTKHSGTPRTRNYGFQYMVKNRELVLTKIVARRPRLPEYCAAYDTHRNLISILKYIYNFQKCLHERIRIHENISNILSRNSCITILPSSRLVPYCVVLQTVLLYSYGSQRIEHYCILHNVLKFLQDLAKVYNLNADNFTQGIQVKPSQRRSAQRGRKKAHE